MPSVAFTEPDMTSYYDSSDDSIRRMTDDFGRHRLTDLMEADESEEDPLGRPLYFSSNRKRYSSSIGSAASSIDALWDLHPRRLSEAGLSRHSDSSAILTEDTDSFIIGQKVWVGGTKPGSIAFIGETQFAPGEWAGIALEEPIGKNDGSVAGIRYFQCEPKKGVFSRLTRLTRVPLDQPDMGSGDTFTYSTPANNGVRRSPISPTGSTRSLLKSPMSISGSNTSISSIAHVDYKLGDRVIIKSSIGSKVGTVRFMGTTDFAPGEWVGVELDEPRGKNDGSVEGKRYFQCSANYGLFAPVSKVSKSPSKVKPASCQVHAGSGLPTGMRRANSKESMTSMTSMTSAASSIRRDVLKEKQQHIEQLLKERDLERAEITRAASQADEAEQKLATLKAEYEQYRAECELKLQEHLRLLTQLKEDRNELVAQLEDEKRKNEDLQFRFEEASINKSDIEVTNEANLERIKELESLLSEEKAKVENFESEATKLFETEENLVKTKEEIEAIKIQLLEATMMESNLKVELASSNEILADLRKELENSKKDNTQYRDTITSLENQVSKLSEDNNNLKQNLEEFKNKISETQAGSQGKDAEMSTLKVDLDNLKKMFEEKSEALEKVSSEKSLLENNLNKEIEKLKMDISGKNHDIETISDDLKSKEEQIMKSETELAKVKEELSQKINDLQQYQNNLNDVEANLKKELEQSREDLKSKSKEMEDIKEVLASQIKEKDLKIEENNNVITKNTNQIESLTKELEEIKNSYEESRKNLEEALKKSCEEKDEKIQELSAELQKKMDQIAKYSSSSTNLEEQLGLKQKELEKLNLELESIKKQYESDITSKTGEIQAASDNIKLKDDLIQSLQTELQTTKLDLESVSRDLVHYQTNLSDVESNLKKERDEIKESLKNKIVELEDAKKEFTDQVNQYESKLSESSNNISKKSEELDALRKEIESLKSVFEESSKGVLEKHKKDLEDREAKVSELLSKIQENECEVAKLSSSSKGLEEHIEVKNKEIQKLTEELEIEKKQHLDFQQKSEGNVKVSNELKKEIDHLQSVIKEMTDREKLQQASESEMKNIIGDVHNQLKERRQQIEELGANMDKQKEEFEAKIKTLSESEANLKQLNETTKAEAEKIKEEFTKKIDELQNVVEEKDNLLKKTSEGASQSEKALAEELQKVKDELQRSISTSQDNMKTLNEESTKLKEELNKKLNELSEVNKNYEKVVADSKKCEEELKCTYEAIIGEVNKALTEKESDLQKIISEVNVLKQDSTGQNDTLLQKEQQITELTKQLQSSQELVKKVAENQNNLQEESKKLIEDNKTQIANLQQELAKLTDTLSSSTKFSETLQLEKNYYSLLIENLTMTDKQKTKLLDDLQKVSTNNNDNKQIITIAKSIKVLNDEENARKIEELQIALDVTQTGLTDSEKLIHTQKGEIAVLKEKLRKAEEKPAVTTNGATAEPNEAQLKSNSDYKQLLEEKIFAENQVAFLNSIIVDMQKKNEEQKARIEILEMGFSPSAANELNLMGFHADGRRLPAPRMFCDICDEFDLHETEDCPQQTSDEPVLGDHLMGKREPHEKPPPREYCEICGVFGHATENCTDDQTF